VYDLGFGTGFKHTKPSYQVAVRVFGHVSCKWDYTCIDLNDSKAKSDENDLCW
jgi:hypothetical protein